MVSENGSDLYEQLKKAEPMRDVELPKDELIELGDDEIDYGNGGNGNGNGGNGEDDDFLKPRSATSALGMKKLSDVQTAIKIMNPDLGDVDLNNLVWGRTFPDVYNPLSKMLVKDLLLRSKGRPDVSVVSIMVKVNTGLSKSIDGEAIIDHLALMGVRRAEEERDKNSLLGA
jgi:hypothetical protein